jgi:hypothetical protein
MTALSAVVNSASSILGISLLGQNKMFKKCTAAMTAQYAVEKGSIQYVGYLIVGPDQNV